ncbi:hypothetical protein [Vibrio coralliilyticus]|uniref:Uncharacterized protein n=1 Tax=Vibrio coralliilyticus TaxID=190893 RepID=A0AAP6ZX90_9VIBR|nr:hypothetical protein [Vibrio coralliilyticus]NOJ26339.1 hypothetical protein [Vibrio coralliilyticus]
MSIDHLDHRAQPRVNREWYEQAIEKAEKNGTFVSEAMRQGAELITTSLDSGVVPACRIDIDPKGKITLTPIKPTERS